MPLGQPEGSAAPALGTTAVLVPVKSFRDAKLRLAPALSPERRAQLARKMADRVVASAGSLPVAVVCDDREVAGWARSAGALVIWEPGRGLNGAVQEGVRRLAGFGVELVIVAAGDLPLARDLSWIGDFPGITIIPDRHGDGSNVIAVPASVGFSFSYGPGSFARHLDEARRTGAAFRVIRDTPLAWDVDVPDDLAVVTVQGVTA